MPDKHVFVSYAREDRNFARNVDKHLREDGKVPWRDLRDIRGGQDWHAEIDKALRNAAALIVVISPASINSPWVNYEWAFALGAGVPVIPVIRQEATPHPRLGRLNAIDFASRQGQPWVDLRKALPPAEGPVAEKQLPIKANPKIVVKFSLVRGKPAREDGDYVLLVSIRDLPPNAERVTYEALDETLDQRKKWSSRAAAKNFETQFWSNGEVLVSAIIHTPKRDVHLVSSLSEALQRGHGRNAPKPLRDAIRKMRT